MKTRPNRRKSPDPIFAVILPIINDFQSLMPIQQNCLLQRQPMLAQIFCIFLIIPFHPPQPIPIRINATLTTPTNRGPK